MKVWGANGTKRSALQISCHSWQTGKDNKKFWFLFPSFQIRICKHQKCMSHGQNMQHPSFILILLYNLPTASFGNPFHQEPPLHFQRAVWVEHANYIPRTNPHSHTETREGHLSYWPISESYTVRCQKQRAGPAADKSDMSGGDEKPFG